MKTIEQIKSEVWAKWPDADSELHKDGWRVWWDERTESTCEWNSEDDAWREALEVIMSDPGSPGMRPETMALIQAEIEHIDQFLSLPPESESYRQVHIAMKNQRVFIDKLLKSERQA